MLTTHQRVCNVITWANEKPTTTQMQKYDYFCEPHFHSLSGTIAFWCQSLGKGQGRVKINRILRRLWWKTTGFFFFFQKGFKNIGAPFW